MAEEKTCLSEMSRYGLVSITARQINILKTLTTSAPMSLQSDRVEPMSRWIQVHVSLYLEYTVTTCVS
jgi:hypothetical protein